MGNKKQKTWRLIYPDKTESLMNFNPIKEERRIIVNEVLRLIKAWDGYGDDRFPEGDAQPLCYVGDRKIVRSPSPSGDDSALTRKVKS